MDAELKTKWLMALRSGKYSQGMRALKTTGGEYCCLGVLCEEAGVNWRHSTEDNFVPENLPEAALYVSPEYGLDHNTQYELARMNDDGNSFAKIADWIEANL